MAGARRPTYTYRTMNAIIYILLSLIHNLATANYTKETSGVQDNRHYALWRLANENPHRNGVNETDQRTKAYHEWPEQEPADHVTVLTSTSVRTNPVGVNYT